MHELSVTQGLLDTVIAEATKNDATKVLSVSIVMGEYYDYIPEVMQEYFEALGEGTIAESAIIKAEIVPVKIFCEKCNKEYSGKGISAIRCTTCGTNKIQVLSGKEFYIKNLEIQS